MSRSLPALLAALMVLSSPVIALSAGGHGSTEGPDSAFQPTPPEPVDNTTARLTIPQNDLAAAEYETATVDVGGSLADDNDAIHSEFESLSLQKEFDAAGSEEEQRTVVLEAVVALRDRVETLDTRQRMALQQYSQGEITARQLVVELARIDAEAARIQQTAGEVNVHASEVSGVSVSLQLRAINATASTLEGPVRNRAGNALRGDAARTRIYVQASETGVVLGMIRGDKYVREAYRSDYRNEAEAVGNQIQIEQHIEELYPWAWDNQQAISGSGIWSAGLYRITINHPHGRTTSYIDTATKEVFHEVQVLDVEEMPTREMANVTRGNLRVVINRSYPGGPMQIQLHNSATGDPVDGSITISGGNQLYTGEDGTMWLVEPRTQYDLSISDGSETVNVTVAS